MTNIFSDLIIIVQQGQKNFDTVTLLLFILRKSQENEEDPFSASITMKYALVSMWPFLYQLQLNPLLTPQIPIDSLSLSPCKTLQS